MSLDMAKIAFTSDYPIDKIAETLTGSFTLSAWSGTTAVSTHTINHSQGRKCLPEMIWSFDQNIWYDSGFETVDYIGCAVACDTNTATFYAYNDSIPSGITIYYRLYLLWPN